MTPNPVQVMYLAARTCREEGSPMHVWDQLEKPGHLVRLNPKGVGSILLKEQEDMIQKVVGYGHESIMEHVSFTFMIEQVSRALTHQLVRHRLCTFSQQSLRAVKPGNFIDLSEFFVDDAAQDMHGENVRELYELASDTYETLVNNGVPKERARWVLPIGTLTNIMMTCNLRELRHICRHRLCLRAQDEIREMTKHMVTLVRGSNDFIGRALGTKCELMEECTDVCPQGRNKKKADKGSAD